MTTATETEAQVIGEFAISSVDPHALDPEVLHGVTVPQGAVFEIHDLEHHLDAPRRAKGTTVVHDATTFATLFARLGDPDRALIYADVDKFGLVAVLNDSKSHNEPGWGDHRIVFSPALTQPWLAWTEHDGIELPQADFAEHIEANILDIVTPDGATMLELVQTFQAKTGVEFESSQLLPSGERQLTYKESTGASAGREGQIEVPKEIVLGIAPFQGAPPYEIRARFRFRIRNGHLHMAYLLNRPDEVRRSAFADVLNDVEEKTGATALRGLPPRR